MIAKYAGGQSAEELDEGHRDPDRDELKTSETDGEPEHVSPDGCLHVPDLPCEIGFRGKVREYVFPKLIAGKRSF